MNNPIDRIVTFFAPKSGLERQRYRLATKLLEEQERRFDAAANGRRTSGWNSNTNSVNAEVGVALAQLRNRSRDLVRNNPYAKRAIKAIANNTVGTGIRPNALDATGRNEKRIKDAWKKWAETTACDFDGKNNMYGLQKLALRTVAESGECIIRKRRANNLLVPFQLQLIEGDIIDTDMNSLGFTTDGSFIMHGVEFDKSGRRVAMWLFDQHPGDQYVYRDYKSKRVPMEELMHVYYVERPGQIRGIPFGTASMLRMKDFDDYEDAQLIRQKIAACFSVFVSQSQDGTEEGDLNERVEPGMVYKTAPGETVTFATPPAAEGYSDYSRKILQGIAAGYDTTYEAMTGDLSNVNFSSGRMGWIEFQRNVEDWQENMLIPQLCNPTWQWFMQGLVISGQIAAPFEASWTPPRREMIDPYKETQGQQLAVASGFKSWQETVRESGYNPEEVLAEIKAERERFKELGITLDWGSQPQPAEPSSGNQE
jgi:lambda family phage portal protein